MDTSNSIQPAQKFGFTLRELHDSEEPEAKALADRCELVITELHRRLKPCLKYVSKPRPIGDESLSSTTHLVGPMAVSRVGSNAHVYILRNGDFRVYELIGKFLQHLEEADDLPWHDCAYDELLLGLQRTLADAELKREANLRSIREQRKCVDSVLEGLGIRAKKKPEPVHHTCGHHLAGDNYCPSCELTGHD